jgi:hypothetical protein
LLKHGILGGGHMTVTNDFNDSIISKKRKGDVSDPFKSITETLVIINGKALLTEIPSRFEKVSVTGATKTLYETEDGALTDTLYKVDYIEGVVFFNSVYNNKSLNFSYVGEGRHFFPANSVWLTQSVDGEIQTAKEKFDSLDGDILEQKSRVDSLIVNNPQPTEVVDLRVDSDGVTHVVARDRLASDYTKTNGRINTLEDRVNYSEKYLTLNNEGSGEVKYQVDIANFGGQGLYPAGDVNNNNYRAFVIHQYNDSDMCVLDSVGEGNVFFLLRNANNPVRRADKPANFYGKSDFFRLQNMYDNAGTLQAVTVFELKNNGNFVWGHQGAEINSGVKFINNQPSNNGNFAFTLKNTYQNNNVLDIQSADGKSVLYIQNGAGTRTDITSSNAMISGMRIAAGAGILSLAAGSSSSINFESPMFSKTSTGWAQLARFVPKPTTATAVGERGDYFCDAAHLYVCQGTNSWVRVPVATW